MTLNANSKQEVIKTDQHTLSLAKHREKRFSRKKAVIYSVEDKNKVKEPID